jgi:fructose-bisphosphate aldolase, class I
MEINSDQLEIIAKRLVRPGKGILAADESNETAGKRLEMVGLENSSANRQEFRDIFLATPNIETFMSGVILFEETLFQSSLDGRLFADILHDKGIIAGIKVDKGLVDFPGFPEEHLTEGLDGLRNRLREYKKAGAEFTKFRCVFKIGEGLPTMECIHLNSIALALYARIAQEEGFVPLVEPEVLYEGSHSIEEAEEVTEKVLSHLFYELKRLKAEMRGLILKTSMVIDGSENGLEAAPEDVARRTVRTLKETVPPEVPGIVFLSGGQTHEEAISNYAAIARHDPLPWEISFSFARALQEPVLHVWQGNPANVDKAREMFIEVLERAVEADKGRSTVDRTV